MSIEAANNNLYFLHSPDEAEIRHCVLTDERSQIANGIMLLMLTNEPAGPTLDEYIGKHIEALAIQTEEPDFEMIRELGLKLATAFALKRYLDNPENDTAETHYLQCIAVEDKDQSNLYRLGPVVTETERNLINQTFIALNTRNIQTSDLGRFKTFLSSLIAEHSNQGFLEVCSMMIGYLELTKTWNSTNFNEHKTQLEMIHVARRQLPKEIRRYLNEVSAPLRHVLLGSD